MEVFASPSTSLSFGHSLLSSQMHFSIYVKISLKEKCILYIAHLVLALNKTSTEGSTLDSSLFLYGAKFVSLTTYPFTREIIKQTYGITSPEHIYYLGYVIPKFLKRIFENSALSSFTKYEK